MKEVKVREVMISLSKYITVKKTDNLVEMLQALEAARRSKSEHAHRDAIVVDENGIFIGKVTMIDVFRALEPNYTKLYDNQRKGILPADWVAKSIRDLNLWMEPTKTICERGSRLLVSEIMHTPEKTEFIQETDTLEKALHLYVMNVHQPLIVKNGTEYTGVLRFGDVFEVLRKDLLNCTLTDND